MKTSFRSRISKGSNDRRIINVPSDYKPDVDQFGDALVKVVVESIRSTNKGGVKK